MTRDRWRVPAYLALAALPWSVVNAYGTVTLVFPFGLLNFSPLYLTDIVSYVTVNTGALPDFLLAWPIGVGFYLLALASLASGLVLGREDRRLTAGLIALAGLTQVSLVLGFTPRLGTSAFPAGALVCWLAVWWFDWPALRRTLPAGAGE